VETIHCVRCGCEETIAPELPFLPADWAPAVRRVDEVPAMVGVLCPWCLTPRELALGIGDGDQ